MIVVIVKGSIIVKLYIPKKHRRFGTEINKLCNSTGHTYNMEVYGGRTNSSWQNTLQHHMPQS